MYLSPGPGDFPYFSPESIVVKSQEADVNILDRNQSIFQILVTVLTVWNPFII